MSELSFQIGEHIFVPRPLKKGEEVLFANEKKENQMWRRQMDFPDYFWNWSKEVELNADFTRKNDDNTFKCLSKEDTKILKHFQDRELIRRQQGVYFMNNGELTYLTGDHYFALQWNAMDGADNEVEPGSKYGMYVEFQRTFFYFYLIAEKTPHGYGGIFVKPKKTGISQCMAAICVNRGTMMRNKNIRIMSTDHVNCKNVNFKYIKYAIEHLPNIMCPEIQKMNLGQVFFAPEEVGKTQEKRLRATNKDALYTDISAIPTKFNGFDQSLNEIAWFDEEAKTENPEATHHPTIASVKLGMKRMGTVMYTYYVPEANSSDDGAKVKAESVRQAHEIYKNSSLSTIDEVTQMTKSQMVKHTLTVQEGTFGMVDKYGKPLVKKIWAELNAKYNALKGNPNALISYKKQNPTNEEEPWMEGGNQRSVFDNIRLGIRLKNIQMELGLGTLEMVTGNLKWSKEPKYIESKRSYDFTDCSVYFRQDTDEEIIAGKQRGNFVFYRPKLLPQDKFNKYAIDKSNNLRKPLFDTPYFLSLDPTNYSDKKMISSRSQTALMGFLLPDAELDSFYGSKVSHRLIMQYLCRRDKAEDTVWDVAMAIIYLGCYLLAEGNMPTVVTRLIDIGLGNYVLVKNSSTEAFEPYKESKRQKFYTTSVGSQKSTIDTYITAGKNYLGEPDEEEFDNLSNLDSEAVIKDLINFEPENTRKFDAGVAYLIGIMGIEAYIGWKHAEQKKTIHEFDKITAAALRASIS